MTCKFHEITAAYVKKKLYEAFSSDMMSLGSALVGDVLLLLV